MKAEVISTEYIGEKRITTVVYTYTESDDIMKLGQLYYALGQLIAKRDQLLPIKAEAEANPESAHANYKAELERINTEIATYTALVEKQHEYVNGYKEKQ